MSSSPGTDTTRSFMKCRLYKIVYRTVLLIYIGAIAFLCFANLNGLPSIQKSFFGIPADKLVHFAMFFPFPWLAYCAVDRKPKSVGEIVAGIVSICSAGCIFAGITEIVQGTLPYRSEDIKDFATDCLAICLCGAILLAFYTVKFRKGRNR